MQAVGIAAKGMTGGTDETEGIELGKEAVLKTSTSSLNKARLRTLNRIG